MYSEWLERKVGQVVLVVIDALRADFVLPENLLKQSGQFSRGEGAWPTVSHGTGNGDGGATGNSRRPKIRSLHDLIEDESELVNAFLARANTPTVTLPRIKVSSKILIFPGFLLY
jgi:predicted AlkP superfamily pyrophosphatase or phosphodiesterase